METVRDRLWVWGHEAGSHNQAWGLPGPSRMTPAEAAYYLDVPNVLMVGYSGQPQPPWDQRALAVSPLRRLVWSIVGAAAEHVDSFGEAEGQLEAVLRLAARYPQLEGVIMDDFFGQAGTFSPPELEALRRRLVVGDRRLDLWVVLYARELLGLPVAAQLEACDVVNFWTWKLEELADLEHNFALLEQTSPGTRKVLGCYMWAYGDAQPMPVEQMERQCRLGLEWLRDGRIEGVVFLASCICDLELPAVEWTRRWIAKVGDQAL